MAKRKRVTFESILKKIDCHIKRLQEELSECVRPLEEAKRLASYLDDDPVPDEEGDSHVPEPPNAYGKVLPLKREVSSDARADNGRNRDAGPVATPDGGVLGPIREELGMADGSQPGGVESCSPQVVDRPASVPSGGVGEGITVLWGDTGKVVELRDSAACAAPQGSEGEHQ
jgi:hypothetical protein